MYFDGRFDSKMKRRIERYVLFIILFGIALFLAQHDTEGLLGAYALNISTELIGVILLFLIFQRRLRSLLFAILLGLWLLSLSVLFLTTGLEQGFVLNISSEIAGALIIALTLRGLIFDHSDLFMLEIQEMSKDHQRQMRDILNTNNTIRRRW